MGSEEKGVAPYKEEAVIKLEKCWLRSFWLIQIANDLGKREVFFSRFTIALSTASKVIETRCSTNGFSEDAMGA